MAKNGLQQNISPIRHLGPLILVILLHLGFFLALQQGLNQPLKEVPPKEMVAILIPPSAPPAPAINETPKAQAVPAKPQPAPPKPAPKPEKPVAKPVPPPPKPEPAPKAITPAPEPRPVAPAEPVAPVTPPAPATPATPAAPAAAPSASAAAPAASTAPAGPVQPKTVTSGVEYLQLQQPEYPALSRRLGEEGTVMLRVLINERGRAERVEIHKSSGIPRLDEAARHAVLRSTFKPYMENGRPIPVSTLVPIKFQLND